MSWSLIENSFTSDPFANLFRNFFHDAPGTLGRRASPRAPIAAWQGDDDVLIRVELPGYSPDDIEISVEGDRLTLHADSRKETLAEGEQLHRRERSDGKVSREVRLPYRIDSDKIEADYQNGVLELHLPRAAEDRPHSIKVK